MESQDIHLVPTNHHQIGSDFSVKTIKNVARFQAKEIGIVSPLDGNPEKFRDSGHAVIERNDLTSPKAARLLGRQRQLRLKRSAK